MEFFNILCKTDLLPRYFSLREKLLLLMMWNRSWRCMREVMLGQMRHPSLLMLTELNHWTILPKDSVYRKTQIDSDSQTALRRCDLLPAWLQSLWTGGWSRVMVGKWGRHPVTLHRANPPDQRGLCQPSNKVRCCSPLPYLLSHFKTLPAAITVNELTPGREEEERHIVIELRVKAKMQ